MAELPKTRINGRKLLSMIEMTSEASMGKDFQELSGEIVSIVSDFQDEFTQKEQMKYDENVSAILVRSRTELSENLRNRILVSLGKLFPSNNYVKLFRGIELIKGGKPEEGLVEVETTTGWEQNEEFFDAVSRSDISDEKIGYIVVKSAESGGGNASLWDRFMRSGRHKDDVVSVIDALNVSNHLKTLENFLTVVIQYDPDPLYTVKMCQVLNALGKRTELIDLLGEMNIFSLEDSSQINTVCDLMLQSGLYGKALDLCNRGLEMFQDEHLIMVRAESLIGTGNLNGAIKVYQDMMEKYPDNVDYRIRCARLQYEAGKYADCSETFRKVPYSKLDEGDFTAMIRAKASTSMTIEALTDVSEMMTIYGKTIENLHIRMDLEKSLDMASECYYTAEEILELDPDDESAREFYRNYLFRNLEYEKFLKFINGDERNALIPEVIVALAGTGEFMDAVGLMKLNPHSLEYPKVWDSIFFSARTSEQLRALENCITGLDTPGSRNIGKIIGFIRGRSNAEENVDWEDVSDLGSVSIAYIDIMSLFNSGRFSEIEQSLSFLPENRFSSLRNIIEYMIQVRSGKRTGDIVDSSDFMYPATWILIRNGLYEDAYSKLTKLENPHPDPFYIYYESLIMEGRGDYTGSRKNIRRAIEDLENFMFMDLSARMSLRCGDFRDVISVYEELFRSGGQDSIDFQAIYNILSGAKSQEFTINFIDLCDYNSFSNRWVKRLKRDMLLERSEWKTAYDISRNIIVEGGLEESDIASHLSIVEKMDLEHDRISFLEDVRSDLETPRIDVMIGDIYFTNGRYEKALQCYRDAIRNGMDPTKIHNYAETLINTGNYNEASVAISNLNSPPLLLVKLYSGKNDIENLLKLLNNFAIRDEKDEDALIFVCNSHWRDPDVRKKLKDIYSNGGYLFLGKAIAEKLTQDGSYDEATDILRNMFKNYPEDVQVARMYSGMLMRRGDRSEAIRSLSRGLKNSKSMEDAMEFTNELLRTYYDDGDYRSVTDLYETDPSLVDRDGLKIIIRSYIALDKFDDAERVMSRQAKMLDQGLNDDLYVELQSRKNFTELLTYINRLLKLEYKAGREFNVNEAVYKAEIPVDKMAEVLDFLRADRYFGEPNPDKYELLSRDVIKRIVKDTGVEKITDVQIFMIYGNLDRKDAVVAVNIYNYIMERIRRVNIPRTEDAEIMKMVRKALKDNIPSEPLHLMYMLDIGISTAMDVIALMDYMAGIKNMEREDR